MLINRFLKSTDGNFAMMFAVLLPVTLGAVGVAVDFASMSRAHSKLQNAVDSAVLAASRINDKNLDRKQIFRDYLDANLLSEPELKVLEAKLEIETGINFISTVGSAYAELDLNFPIFYGRESHIFAEASAYESRDNLEVVLALDNTGSMGEARMKELRKAATSLIDILSTVHSPDTEPKRVVRAALVPFVTAVNVKGVGFKDSWIDGYKDFDAGIAREHGAKYHGANFDKVAGKPVNHFDLFKALDVKWKGCVEARPGPYNLTDDAPDPTTPDTMFVPYFAPDNPGKDGKSPNSGNLWNNSYLNDNYGNGDAAKLKKPARYYGVSSGDKYIEDNQSRTTGPNYACPTPITPLTSDFDVLKTDISKMIYWEGSGTNVSEGLAWSYRLLSPKEPYADAVPFHTENTSKFAVVFTDGENTVFGASSQPYNKSDYGSYSFLDQGRTGETDRGKALTKVNTMTLDVCTSLKAKGIEVFTVLLGADTQANRTLYSKCATTPEHYYPTSDVNQLDVVFKKIAARIAKLYVTG